MRISEIAVRVGKLTCFSPLLRLGRVINLCLNRHHSVESLPSDDILSEEAAKSKWMLQRHTPRLKSRHLDITARERSHEKEESLRC